MWIFGFKSVPFESILKELSNDMWITKIGFKMRKLWPFKVRSKFQTRAPIAIVGNRQRKGDWQKDCNFSNHNHEKYTEICDRDHEPVWKKIGTPLKNPKTSPFPSNLHQSSFSSLPPFSTLKEKLLLPIFSLKFSPRLLEIGLSPSEKQP